MHELAKAFVQTLAGKVQRKSVTTASRWAEKYRIIKSKPWTFDKHPWLREMHDSDAEFNVGRKAAQVGFTETVLNRTFFNIDIKQLDCLYVLPAKTPDASDFSSSRFDPAVEESEHLSRLFDDVKNVGHKRAGSANLYIRGATSRSGLKSIPVGFLVLDELDEMPEENIPLAEERTSGQVDRQIWKISTPTVPNFGIDAAFNESTQDHYVFKCPRCSRHTELIPDCLIVTGDSLLDPRLSDSHIICKECKGRLEHETKGIWLANGEWHPFGDPTAAVRGFYVNQLYSSAAACRPEAIARSVIKAQANKADEQELWNSKFGLPHVVEGAQLVINQVKACIRDHTKADVKPTSGVVTMGVDVGRWLHCEIALWQIGRWGNDININSRPKILWEGKVVTFDELGQLMHNWQIRQCVIDMLPERRKVFEFAAKFWGYVKMCIFGRGVSGKSIQIDSDNDEHRITVDRTSWLDLSLGRFHSGTIDLPRDTSGEYIAHATNLVRRYRKDSHDQDVGEYVSVGEDHFAFARTYNEIALPLAASMQTNENIKSYL